jgi:hypothetical protein
VLVTAAASMARADVVIYNNFGPGDTYFTNGGYVIGFGGRPGQENIVDFFPFQVTGASYALTRIDLALSYRFGPNAIDVQIRGDSGGLPGPVIETWHFSNLPPFPTL